MCRGWREHAAIWCSGSKAELKTAQNINLARVSATLLVNFAGLTASVALSLAVFDLSFQVTISKYLVIELKKGFINLADSGTRDYNQLMKYVDWVCDEYAHGDYSMIEAFLVASDFSFEKSDAMHDAISRPYVTGHNAESHIWENVSFVKYTVDSDGILHLDRV